MARYFCHGSMKTYSPRDLTVLLIMKIQVPFSHFNMVVPTYISSEGLLPLSNKQRQHFYDWKRPHQIARNPTIISLVSRTHFFIEMIFLCLQIFFFAGLINWFICFKSAYTVTQTLISDCSFVAALSVVASYQRRHNKRLIENCIYPQVNYFLE